MRWRGREQSENVEDRRGVSPRGLALGGGVGGLAILLIYMLLGGDPLQLLNLQNQTRLSTQPQPAPPATPEEQAARAFVGVVLKDTEDVWGALFQTMGKTYEPPHLVLFSAEVSSACGLAGTAVGPFYCPEDANVYLDMEFFQELKRRFGAPGDFAQAYVIAHEVGHHVQNLLGISAQLARERSRMSEAEYHQLSVRLELQADFFAGVWAHHAQATMHILEPGDVEEALRAASAIGDDRLQMQARGYITPDSFTHGTSEQRVRWFRLGFETGDLRRGDTFGADRL